MPPLPRLSLRAFLSHAKTSLQTSRPLTLVIGNESADLDSLASALLYAYIRSLFPLPSPTPKNNNPQPAPPTRPPQLHIPLLAIPRADIALRPEFQPLFRHAGIQAEGLVTLDELLDVVDDEEDTEWVLVDHNALQGALGERFAHRVRGVVDHHEDEGVVPTDVETRVVEKCGSCTSLVVRTVRDGWEEAAAAAEEEGGDDALVEDARAWDAQVAKMALASILIDTANLTAEGKVELADRDAVAFLEAKITSSLKDPEGWDRGAFYREIEAAKTDIGGLGFQDILRKDYKQWTETGLELGISSVVKPIEFVARKALEGTTANGENDAETEFVTRVGDFMAERNLTVFALMTAFTASPEGRFQRELYVQALSAGHAAANRFTEEATAELGLEDLAVEVLEGRPGAMRPESEGPWRKVWRQGEVGKSRKQVAPLLRRAMGKEAGCHAFIYDSTPRKPD
ncbi:MAG: hypothetical protein LQ345_005524 [Seirophora villosa]|nr:MAG: hypothetical protein LQ345_005524 [Seirophora villosa]